MAARPLESEEKSSVYGNRKSPALIPKKRLAAEVDAPCARFAFPTITTRAEIALARFMSRWDALEDAALVVSPELPANWQLFMRYLYRRGVVSSPTPQFPRMRNDLPPLATVSLSTPRTAPEKSLVSYGFGTAPDLETALSKALGELLERSAISLSPKSCIRASYGELQKKKFSKTLDIFSLNGFLEWQYEAFPILKRSAEAPIAWVRGIELVSNTSAYIPAQLVFLRGHDDDNMTLAQSTTNGSAGHFTRTEAIVSAIGELIERDGFLIYWLNSIAPKRVDPTTITDPQIVTLLERLNRYDIEYHILDTTTDIRVPSCIAVLIDRKSPEAIVAIGGGAGLSAAHIIFSALTEALTVLREEIDAPALVLPHDYTPFSDPHINRAERLHVWHGEKMLDEFSFFIQGPFETFEAFTGDSWKYQTPEQQLAYLKEMFSAMGEGYEMYVHEIRSRLLSDIGYHVVKVVIPRLVALHLRETMATLAAPRLKSVPQKLGYTSAETYNPWPHPFP